LKNIGTDRRWLLCLGYYWAWI